MRPDSAALDRTHECLIDTVFICDCLLAAPVIEDGNGDVGIDLSRHASLSSSVFQVGSRTSDTEVSRIAARRVITGMHETNTEGKGSDPFLVGDSMRESSAFDLPVPEFIPGTYPFPTPILWSVRDSDFQSFVIGTGLMLDWFISQHVTVNSPTLIVDIAETPRVDGIPTFINVADPHEPMLQGCRGY